jgi:cytochrome P450
MHRDPDVFPDPEVFDPSRFLDTSLRGSPNYAPFGHGPRNCVAQGMAMQQLAAILVGLLRNHQIAMPNPHLPEVIQIPFLTPAPFDVEITQV